MQQVNRCVWGDLDSQWVLQAWAGGSADEKRDWLEWGLLGQSRRLPIWSSESESFARRIMQAKIGEFHEPAGSAPGARC
jgi:hypothetical protein